MSDSEDATDARINELFEEPQDHANVPTPDNANIPAPDNANIILGPKKANIPTPDNVPKPASSENASSPRVLSEADYANWIYNGPSGRGWAREKTPWRPRREKPSAKNAAGETTGGQGTRRHRRLVAMPPPSLTRRRRHPSTTTSPTRRPAATNAVQQQLDQATLEELPADPPTRTTGPGDYDWGPAPAFALDEPDMDAQTQAELFALFNNGAFERPAVPEEEPLAGGSASAAANTVSPSSFPEVVTAAQGQQQEPDDGNDEDAERDEFDYLFEEEESSTAADRSTVAGTPANDSQTPGTEYSDANSNFK
ncbi:hypothetical protein DIS24_g9348 [Lasiodiplodia hormozganensis]|uniref:Uncharacterized protein n=1 Tax=Lasiodiplodia hormozganensis TaxID=869390 RepID=A0AA40CKJ2_9PEZI|nr:hypothetical protein DIS24_g9348 [Lasiodiplodia hormozganensis]